MASTVYMLGAGINRSLSVTQHVDGVAPYILKPPLALDFFQQALLLPEVYRERDYAYHLEQFEALYHYIKRFWRLAPEELKTKSFDLEACFTRIQQQREAQQDDETDEYHRLWQVNQQLMALLRRLLSEFELGGAALVRALLDKNVQDFLKLAKTIVEERAAVLTFNYDTILESAIEFVSGTQDPGSFKDGFEDVRYSHYSWNRPLAYGIKFDEVTLHKAGNTMSVSKEDFYAPPGNQLYHPPLLKLHGSTNWGVDTGVRYEMGKLVTYEERKGLTRVGKSLSIGWLHNQLQDLEEETFEPLIITPVLNKDYSREPFQEIWQQAKRELSECERLIVGGYSFPPTDTATRELLRGAFADNSLEELVLINPDRSLVAKVKDYCCFNKSVDACQDLEEFIRTKVRPS